MARIKNPDTRWAWVEIDTAAVKRNTRTLKSLLGRGTRMMCVVKADAYGHGAVACAKAMRTAGADQFAVATVEEGAELRRAGIDQPILLLSEPPIEAVAKLVEFVVMPSIYTTEFALAYGECAAANNKVGAYHLAIDTGMNRIGVLPRDAVDFRRAIDFHRGLSCEGVYTHFATAEVLDDWDYRLQLNRFVETVNGLIDAGLDVGIVHCDNTPGTILHPEAHFDMCRAGIGLYGLQPAPTCSTRVQLDPVMSVRARVTRVEWPPVGAGVGYGFTYRVPKQNIQIATVPFGYADGLSRTLSNRMDVLCGGARHRQVGNICMDQFMFAVEVNTTKRYRPVSPVDHGDLVTIIGTDGEDAITADDHAELRGTINYEVTCNFGMRLEKVYV